MSHTASEQILQFVEQSRQRAKKAERAFDNENRYIQRKAERDIDLFGGTATSQVVELASDARRACDDLYAAYQMEIRLLDEACRPLLEQQPSLEAVKAVFTLIKWLNDESEIENNFTASFNSRALGQVASVKYVPTMENKMIQRYWEAKYDSCPGRAEEIAAEKARRQQAAQEAKRRAEAEQAKRKEAERQKKAAEEQAQAAISQRITGIVADLKAKISAAEQTLSETASKANGIIAQEESSLAVLQAERNQLGLFKRKEKQTLDQQISALQLQLKQRKESLAQVQVHHNNQIEDWKKKLSLVCPVPKGDFTFGTRFWSFNKQPMTWIVMSNDGREVRLLAKQTVDCRRYGSVYSWMNTDFLKKVFSPAEQAALLPITQRDRTEKVVLPTPVDVRACCPGLGTSPETNLVASIRANKEAEGRQLNYNARQIENATESELSRATTYWFHTDQNDRSGFANYAGRSSGLWVSAKIGAASSCGVRPMICLDLNKLLDMI